MLFPNPRFLVHLGSASLQDYKNGHDAERAFIITSGGRDWGILMCRWLQYKPRDVYGRPEVGNMVEPRLFLRTSKGWQPTDLRYVAISQSEVD